MLAEKRYEILEGLPTYGTMPVTVSDNNDPFYSEGYVVRFYKKDGTDWVANFVPGWSKTRGIFELTGSNLLILADGTCYVMDPENTAPISVFGVGFSAVFELPDGRFVLQDQVNLTVVEKDGSYRNSERISWDGFKDIKVEGTLIKGLCWTPIDKTNDEWLPFTYDVATGVLTNGAFSTYTQQI